MHADLRVHDEEKEVRLFDGRRDLAPDLGVHGRVRVVGESARVHEPEGAAVPLRLGEVAVARRARLLGDDGARRRR